MLRITNSLALLQRAESTIPSATQTFSKKYNQYSFGVSPIFLKRADGPYVWDVDDNRFIDTPGALGPIILGHNHPSVVAALTTQLANGIAFSLPHVIEIEVAEMLKSLIPHAEMSRFGKNGSDATAGAVRAARAYTGKDYVACCGYHGWQDWYIGTTSRNKGVPDAVKRLTLPFSYNNISSLQALFSEHPNQIAAVILEPFGTVLPENDFLQRVVDLSHKNGAVVIFDECWTGFRLSISGASGYFNVSPDISCFGKALGNGVPISAVCGIKEIMKVFDEVFFSFTFGGDLLGLTAAKAVLRELAEKPVLEQLWRAGEKILAGARELIDKKHLSRWVRLNGLPPRTIFSFTNDEGKEWLALKSLLQQEIHQRGVLFGGYHTVTLSYTDEIIEELLNAYAEAFDQVEKAIKSGDVNQRLRGRIVEPVFRRP